MRIAFVVGSVFPAMSETFIINQITGLIDRGHEVDIYAEKPELVAELHPDIKTYHLLDYTYYHQVPQRYLLRLLQGLRLIITGLCKKPVVTLKSLNLFKYGRQATSLKLLYQVSLHFDKQPYDIIQCHFGYNGLRGLVLRDLGVLQGKFVTAFHGLDLSQDIQAQGVHLYDQLFEQGDLFLPVSEHWKRKLIELGCDPKKVLVHRMGIDLSSFKFIPRQQSNSDQVYLISVSRLTEKKGLEYSIRAVAALIKNGRKIEYTIVGDGTLRDELQQLIQALDVCDSIKLLGWKQKTEVIELLKTSDIFLLPSITSRSGNQEGIPVALMEAMAMGLPVISTFHSGIPELVEHNISGFLVTERDVKGLAAKLDDLITHPELRSQMGWAGYSHIQAQYDIERLNDRLVELYRELLVSQNTMQSIQECNPCRQIIFNQSIN
jgi:colanic acid/amylovoran biosynthesis glycosyltransferase